MRNKAYAFSHPFDRSSTSPANAGEIFFYAETATAQLGMDTAMGDNSAVLGSISSSVVQLGRSLERLDNPVPVSDCTTKAVVHERKKGVGQKEDDHSGYNFEMKM
ncbi:MAG: hypothetical protein KBI01_10920 [Oscillospiraceae bacterium]|nr:hypothetical protein [Oscillospiraceae bacterium]